jgi:hypothetical protein
LRHRDDAKTDWIGVGDRLDPAVWVIEKERGRKPAPDDPSVQNLRRALAAASERFLESERMLANRTVQLGEMLASDGRRESYSSLLDSLTAVVEDTASGKQTYGDLCQFYVNLRHSGVERDAALNALHERVNLKRLR